MSEGESRSSGLVERMRKLCAPMEPRATGAEAVLPELGQMKAVVFDVYGTMLISGSGDIGVNRAEDSARALGESIDAVGGDLHGIDTDREGVELLHRHIYTFHEARRAAGVAYPEVDIREIWRGVITDMTEAKRVSGVDEDAIDALAIEYECRVNPAWPMPGVREVIDAVRASGRMLGIVSNAQFFTPLLFEALLGETHTALGFDERLCVWSYEMLEGKPSTALYERLVMELRSRGVEPGEVLYVGNDVRNDVRPAAEVGLRTVLFAGDRRSLRRREDDPTCAEVRADAVVTSLDQLRRVAGLRV